MRSLSLAALAVIAVSATVGFAAASQIGPANHLRPLGVQKVDRVSRPQRMAADGTAEYIVRLADKPAATYRGGVRDLLATDPHLTGAKILDVSSPEALRYVSYLDEQQESLLQAAEQRIGRGLTPRYRYHYAFNGLSLRLNRQEALHVAELPGVASVTPVRYFRPVTSVSTPATATDTFFSRSWINAPTVWAVPSNGTDNEGEGVVVADVDTGINDQNASFASAPASLLDGYTYFSNNLRFGVCDPHNSSQNSLSTPLNCNDKLIGAYSYTNCPPGTTRDNTKCPSTNPDPNSPEDSEGHGSHTASTAAGNFVNAPFNGGTTPISGVAPHASIIAYDVCDPTDQCSSSDSVQAVDQAMQDQTTIARSWGSKFKGMVLNYSIGGTDDGYDDPVETAFLAAAEAGIYVSAAGGNGGPENVIANDPVNAPVYAVQHVGPWVATMAASTHNGISGNTLTGFTGGTGTPSGSMSGATGTTGFSLAQIVYAGSYPSTSPTTGDPVRSGKAPTSGSSYPGTQGATANAQQCLYPFVSGTFPAGSIVVCDRGTNPLADKAYNVEQGGAGAVVIDTTSTSSQTVEVETYVIPGTLLYNVSDGTTLDAWLNSNVGTTLQAQLSVTTLTSAPPQADEVAGFSSRGPTDTEYDNILKPDLTAPGVSVLAAVSNPKYTSGCNSCASQPETYAFDDGTSMATPHDTGAGALLMQAHPTWSAAEIKSALMLTSVTVADGTSPGLIDQCASLDSGNNCVAGVTLPSPQVRGAGRIDVDAADRTGIIMDISAGEYEAANPDNGGDLTALNLASLANNGCGGSCSWTRTLTSPFKDSTSSVHYTVTVTDKSTGLSVQVSPRSFTLKPRASQTLTVTADTSGVTKTHWAFADVEIAPDGGSVGDSGGAVPTMHLPLAVESVAPAPHVSVSPATLSFTTNSGSTDDGSFTLSNDGQLTLDWNLQVSGAKTSVANAVLGNAAPLSTGSLWTQPNSGAGTGFPSTFFSQSGHGLYAADTFQIGVKTNITQIEADGFAQDSTGPVAISGAIDWYIYADSNNAPKGNPEDGAKDYVWHFRSTGNGAGVNASSGNILLNLATAGEGPAVLEPGKYWLIVDPTFVSSETNSSDPAWFWFVGKSPDGSTSAQIIDPSDALKSGNTWQFLDTSLAFSLTGTVNCSNGGMQGLRVASASGAVKAGGTETVNANFNGGGLASGTYSGGICINSNASDHPLLVLPVTATVNGGSSGGGSSSKGGGDTGLLELAALLVLLRKRGARASS